MKKEFCPPYCLFGDLDESLGCDQCHHSKDKTYDKPIDIDLLWYADIWIKAQILGESGSTQSRLPKRAVRIFRSSTCCSRHFAKRRVGIR